METKKFTKSDLKDGMVVEYRNGKRRVVLNQCFCGIYEFGYFTDYDDDLISEINTLDIVKVFEGRCCSIESLLKTPGKLIWERKEEPITKDVSLEEINTLLKEKYPDVDVFNISIKEGETK